MIDTDKYEGHFAGVWTIHPDIDYNCVLRIDGAVVASIHTDEPTTQLMADAPLLLEEVKRLREILYKIRAYAHNEMDADDAWRVSDIINGKVIE